MKRELTPIDSRTIPALLRLAEEVHAAGKPLRIQRDHEDIAQLVPVGASSRRHGRPTSAGDPLWGLVGMVRDVAGPADVSENVDRYLADAAARHIV